MTAKNLYVIGLKNSDLAPIPSGYYDSPRAPGQYTREYGTPGTCTYTCTCISKQEVKKEEKGA